MNQLNLRARGPSSTCTLLLNKSDTVHELRNKIIDTFKLGEQAFDILHGFPPSALQLSGEVLLNSFLSNNDSIRVQLTTMSGVQCQGKKPLPKNKPPGKGVKRKVGGSCSISSSSPSSFGARIATLPSKNVPSSSSSRSFLVCSPASRAYSSSVSTEPRQKKSGRHYRVSARDVAHSENDIAEHLLSAASGGAGMRNRILRSVFRNAVSHQYDSSKAVARVNAVFAGPTAYRIKELDTSRVLGTGDSRKIEVTFSKGAGYRGDHVDVVDLLSDELLRQVVRIALEGGNGSSSGGGGGGGGDGGGGDGVAAGRDVLKPVNLSRCSPRIFWSLVHRYGPDLKTAIRSILVDLDGECTWLDERKKELSDKARRNLQQKQEAAAATAARKAKAKRSKSSANSNHQDGGSEVITEDTLPLSPSAIATMSDSSGNNTAHAARARGMHLVKEVAAVIRRTVSLGDIIPDEWLKAVDAAVASPPRSLDMDALVTESEELGPIFVVALLPCTAAICSTITQARGESSIACSSPSTSAASLTNSIIVKGNSYKQVKQSTATNGDSFGPLQLSLDQLDMWIDQAQQRIMQVAWHFICGGGCERLRAVLAQLHIRSPGDLRMWRNAPGGLLDALRKLDGDIERLHYWWLGDSNTVVEDAPVPRGAVCATSAISTTTATGDNAHPTDPGDAADTVYSGYLNAQRIRWMCELSVGLLERCAWAVNFVPAETEAEADSEGNSEGEVVGEDDDSAYGTKEEMRAGVVEASKVHPDQHCESDVTATATTAAAGASAAGTRERLQMSNMLVASEGEEITRRRGGDAMAIENARKDEDVQDEENKKFDDEEWQYGPSAHRYIGHRVRLYTDPDCADRDVDCLREQQEEHEQDQDQDKEEAQKTVMNQQQQRGGSSCFCAWGFWEDGTVEAYLPPTQLEPMALWRVRLDEPTKQPMSSSGSSSPSSSSASSSSSSSSPPHAPCPNSAVMVGTGTGSSRVAPGRFEDLEEFELEQAVQRLVLSRNSRSYY